MTPLPSDTYKRLAGLTRAGRKPADVLDELAFICHDGIDAAEAVSITLVRGRRGTTAAHSDPLALELDEIQYELGHGPCMDAGRSGTFLEVSDMTSDPRWPDYCPRAAQLGVRSSVSAPLPMQTEAVGALNVYSRRPDAFDEHAQAAVRELAAIIAAACVDFEAYSSALEHAEQLQTAMASRAVIEQAKGVIMAQNRCTAEAAFEILRSASMNRNVKLRDLAQSIVDSVGHESAGPA